VLTIIIVVSVIALASIYANYNLLKKVEKYEDAVEELQYHTSNLEEFIQQFSDNLTVINNELSQVDIRGSFEADDEVGHTFKTIKLIMAQLQSFNINGK